MMTTIGSAGGAWCLLMIGRTVFLIGAMACIVTCLTTSLGCAAAPAPTDAEAGPDDAAPLTIQNGGFVYALAFSPDGEQLASTSGTVKLWDAETGRERATLKETGAFRCVAFSPDGKTVASGSQNGTIRLWDAETGEARATLKAAAHFYSIAFSSDGKTLAAGGDTRTPEGVRGVIMMWEVSSVREPAALTTGGAVRCLAFSPDSRTLASGGSYDVKLWDAATGRERASLNPIDNTYSIAFSTDGKSLATADSGTLRLWDVSVLQDITGETPIELWGGEVEVVGPSLKRVKLTSFKGGQSFVRYVAFSRAGNLLVSKGLHETVKLWRVATGQEIWHEPRESRPTRPGEPVAVQISPVAVSSDGRTVASASGKAISIWHVNVPTAPAEDDEEPGVVRVGPVTDDRFVFGQYASVSSVAFSPDGRILAAGGRVPAAGDAGVVKLWDVNTGREQVDLRHPGNIQLPGGRGRSTRNVVNSLAFSPDGRTLATAGKYGVKLWSLPAVPQGADLPGFDSGERPESVNLPGFGVGGEAKCVAFSPDGTMLAVATVAREGVGVRLWDVASRQERRTFAVRGFSLSVAFSPDGRSLAVANHDNRLRLFDVASGEEETEIHAQMGPLYGVAFAPDGKSVAAVGQGGVKLWDLMKTEGQTSLQEGVRLQGNINPVGFVTYSPDGKMLATASRSTDNSVVNLWDLPSGEQRATIRDARAFAFSPDGKRLATESVALIEGEGVRVMKLSDVAQVIRPDVVAAQAKAAASEFIDAARDSESNSAAREALNRALVAIGTYEAAVPVLIEGLKDPNGRVRSYCATALGLIGPNAKEAVPMLKEALKDPVVSSAAGEALRAIQPDLQQALRRE